MERYWCHFEKHSSEIVIWRKLLSKVEDEIQFQFLSNPLHWPGTEFAVRVSYLELYNEELFDLLSNSDNVETGMKLKLFEGNDKALVIQNLSENSVRTKHEVYKILAKGTAKRKTAETQMNAHSSRLGIVCTWSRLFNFALCRALFYFPSLSFCFRQ